jgi:ABC-2 type transport system ATP-binding protein
MFAARDRMGPSPNRLLVMTRALDTEQYSEVLAAAGQGGPAALALRDIERRWGARTVLKGATLTLDHGTVAWLGGPNGAGKTTLLRIAAGLIMPHAGSVALRGLDPERDRRTFQRRLGFLSAGDRGLYARLTVVQNLEYWAGLAHVPRHRREALVAAAVTRLGLEELARSRVDRLSMGQRQRVRLAMAFLHEPDVVLMDEPHTSLDDDALELLEAAIAEQCARGGAVLWCSPAGHNLPLRAEVRHILEDGRVVSG